MSTIPELPVVWESPAARTDAVHDVRKAKGALDTALAAAEAARDHLHDTVVQANRAYRVPQSDIGRVLGVSKARVSAIVRDHQNDNQTPDSPTNPEN